MRLGPLQQANPNLLLVLYFAIKALPMIISGVAIYLGYRLFILGVTGQASLSVDTGTVEGQLINAAPGLFFAIGGITALIASIWKGVKIDFDPEAGAMP
jgi:hypothetical protein